MNECKAMGIDVPGLFPATGADTVMAVAYGVENSGGTDPTAIADAVVMQIFL